VCKEARHSSTGWVRYGDVQVRGLEQIAGEWHLGRIPVKPVAAPSPASAPAIRVAGDDAGSCQDN